MYRARMSANASGWNVHPLDDGWMECSAAIFAPTGGLIEILATGLEGCEVQFAVDGQGTRPYILPARRNAYTSRPVLTGHHLVAVRWRGPVAQPSQVEARFLYLSRTISDLERERPEIAAVMKKNNVADFAVCDVLILSQPPGAHCQVYGIFTVDKRALARGAADAPVLKQDFLVNDRSVQPQEITYYTGYPAPGPHRPIAEFCERFGESHYGCVKKNGKWRCLDHRYTFAEFERLPKEPEIRAAIDRAVARARAEIGA